MIDDPLNRIKVKCGSQLPQSKRTEKDVQEIFDMVRQRNELKRKLSRLTNRSIAEMYGVHQRTIDKVVQGNGWTHVEDAA